MRSQLGIRTLAVAIAIATCLSVTSAHAGFLAQLEGFQLANGATHQWKFEGGSALPRQHDTAPAGGFSDLIAVAGPGGSGANDVNMTPMDPSDDVPWSYPAGDPNNIAYVAGYDGMSQAVRPSRTANATSTFGAERVAQSRSAAAFYDPAFTTPSMMTLEAVLKPDAYLDSAAANFFQYVLQQRIGTGARGYFLGQQRGDTSRDVGSIASVVGGGILSDATRARSVPNYTAGDWYYVAVTFDMSVAAGPTTINAWSANLTTGSPLTQTVVNNVTSTGNVSTLVGVGGPAGVLGFYAGANGIQEVFNGLVDNLTVYNLKLSAGQIARHHRALTVPGAPEPTSLVLLALAGVAVAGLRRRVD